MINVMNKLCLFAECKTTPSFNYINCKTPLYCNKHKFENMVNITNKKCIFEGCNVVSNFNYKE